MNKRKINPSKWLLGFNINQGIEVTDAKRTLFLSGQTSNSEDGTPLHKGDLLSQFNLAWENLKQTLSESDMTPENIVRLNIYTTDVPAFIEVSESIVSTYANEGCQPVSTLLGVTALFDPDLMIELEATAVA